MKRRFLLLLLFMLFAQLFLVLLNEFCVGVCRLVSYTRGLRLGVVVGVARVDVAGVDVTRIVEVHTVWVC